MHKIKTLIGTATVFAGCALVNAAPAFADTPAVAFDAGLHFSVGSQLSDSTSTPVVNVAAKWIVRDAESICSESGYAYDDSYGYRAQWNDVRTSEPFLARATYTQEVEVSPTDCSGYSSNNYSYNTWNLAQENAASYSAGWGSSSCNCWSGGSVRRSSGAGQTASYVGQFHGFGLVTDKAPGRGSATIYVDGVRKATINTASPVKSNRVVGFVSYTPYSGYHTVKVVVNSGRVDIDGFVTS